LSSGVNTFQDPHAGGELRSGSIELSKAIEGEKESQLRRLAEFTRRNEKEVPSALEHLKKEIEWEKWKLKQRH